MTTCYMRDHPIYGDDVVWDRDDRSFHPICVEALLPVLNTAPQPIQADSISVKIEMGARPFGHCPHCGIGLPPRKWSAAHRWGCPSCKRRIS